MNYRYQWHSYSGSVTPDNRDYCGITIKKDFSVYIIADGMTTSPKGGELAEELVHSLIAEAESSSEVPTESTVLEWLKTIQDKIRLTYAADSVSYLLVVCQPNGELIILHAGDCLLGIVTERDIQWVISPHTLANAIIPMLHEELAKDPNRNQLTRSFKGRRFVKPECNLITVLPEATLLFASDGFWADRSFQEQRDLIKEEWKPKDALDDISFLLLKNDLSNNHDVTTHSENIISFHRSNNLCSQS